MTSHTELRFRDDARAKLLAGASALADAIRPTLGPEARSVLLAERYGSPIVCDDGVTIARRMTLKDREEQLGVEMLRQSAIRTGRDVGDGTSTSTILAYEILREGLRNVVAGSSAVAVKRRLDIGVAAAVEALGELPRPVASPEDMAHVATVSAHNDLAIGETVARAVGEVGAEGVVEVEEARGTETEVELVDGMRIDRGFLSPYFITDAQRMEAVLEDPYILLHDQKISAMAPLLPLLEQVIQAGRSLVIIAESVDGEALAALVVNKIRGVINAAAVKAPGFGERRKAILGDLAALTGGRVVSPDLGDELEKTTVDELGSARRIVLTVDDATIIDGGGASETIEARREEIRRQIDKTTSDYDREKLEERLARLSGGVAVIRVGARSEAELARRKEAYDDAISSTKAAVAGGVVPGGGVALVRAPAAVQKAADEVAGDEKIGVLTVLRALSAPARQLALNAGVDGGVVVDRIERASGFYGFDARSKAYCDLDQAGVIDATKLVRCALENAVSVSGVLLLTEATMIDVEDEPPGQVTVSAPELI